MNELIQQARELCEEATPGPWEVKVKGNTVESHQVMSPGNGPVCSAISPKTKNAQFIATSRTLVPQLCDALEAAEAENRWIPVSERLPKKPPDYFKDGHWWMVSGEDFIVVDSDGKVYEAHWTYGCSCQNYFWYVNSLTPLTNITHWRPLPEPPKGE